MTVASPSLAKSDPGPLFALALASIALISPLAVHLFMPVIPAVKVAFSVSEAVAQLTFSIALFGMSIATLFYGSLADRHGRRPVLLSGLVLFLVGSIVSAIAQTPLILIAGRLIQAVGAGCGMTLVRTIARDAYGADRLVKAIAYLTMFYTIGPMIAPVVGGLLVDTLGWRSVFGFALIFGAVILIGAYLVIYETRPAAEAGRTSGSMLANIMALFSHVRFGAYVLQSGCCSGTFLAMASADSVLMKDYLHLPATQFGLYFMLFPVGFFTGNLISTRIGNRLSAETMVLAGSIVVVLTVIGQASAILAGYLTPLALFLPGGFVSFGQGLSLPYGQAQAITTIPRIAGTASGVGVFVQYFVGAAFAQLYGLIADGTPGPMLITIALAAAVGLISGGIPFVLKWRGTKATRHRV
jgi:DHA1 family bicyclomycin/chloramphenicol resistance-like MFS transporter